MLVEESLDGLGESGLESWVRVDGIGAEPAIDVDLSEPDKVPETSVGHLQVSHLVVDGGRSKAKIFRDSFDIHHLSAKRLAVAITHPSWFLSSSSWAWT